MSKTQWSVFQYLDADRFLADRAAARVTTPLTELEQKFFDALVQLKQIDSAKKREKIWAELQRLHQVAVQEWDYIETMSLLGYNQKVPEILAHDSTGRLLRAR